MNLLNVHPEKRALPGWLGSGWLVARLFFKVALGRKHLLWLALIILAPAGVTFYLRVFKGGSGAALFEEMIINAFLQFLCLGLSLFWGVSAIRNEIEDKTIVYLFARPIHRSVIFGGKIVSVTLFSSVILSAGVFLVYTVAVGPEGLGELIQELPRLVRAIGVVALACAVYTSLFGLAGVLFRKPMLLSMLFAAGWEGVVSNLPGKFPKLTNMYYLKSLLGLGPDSKGIIAILIPPIQPAGLTESLLTLAGCTVFFFAFCLYLGARKEVRL